MKKKHIYKCHIFVKLMCKKIYFLTLTGNILHFRNRSVLEIHFVPSNNYFVANIIAANRKILNLLIIFVHVRTSVPMETILTMDMWFWCLGGSRGREN
jgi:hypothetical protein